MERSDAGESAVGGPKEPAVSIDCPDPAEVDALVDLWVDLATDQRAHDSHILPEANRAVVRDTLARQAVGGGVRVARLADETVGFVSFDVERGAYEQEETRGVVRNVYVDPEYRNEGVGTALMGAAEAALREAGATVVA
ncbi:GNAT family N-acetyltransferase, partial [Halobellus rufus]|uniref:GNAT family N-acetyltransferase n=1 Tax=Halobellus rufus TaxID=1448860 RepID=UPI000679DE56